MENKSAFFENFLTNNSTVKVSIHTDDFDSSATLLELDFRPLLTFSYFQPSNLAYTLQNSSIALCNACGLNLTISCY